MVIIFLTPLSLSISHQHTTSFYNITRALVINMKFRSFTLIFLLAVAWMVNARPAGGGLGDALKQIVDAVNKLFEGSATFFHPATEGGAIGSCGPHESDTSRIVALVTITLKSMYYSMVVTHIIL